VADGCPETPRLQVRFAEHHLVQAAGHAGGDGSGLPRQHHLVSGAPPRPGDDGGFDLVFRGAAACGGGERAVGREVRAVHHLAERPPGGVVGHGDDHPSILLLAREVGPSRD